jgi:hypothetical protein
MKALIGLLLCISAHAQILSPILYGQSGGGAGPYTLVQQIPSGSTCTNSSGSSATIPCVMSFNITAGHRLFLMIGMAMNTDGEFSSATGCSSSWTSVKKTNTDAYAEILYCSNATGGSTTVTVTMAGNCGAGALYNCSANLSEWSGGAGVVDQTATGSGISGTATTDSVTTTAAQELILAVTGTNSGGSLSSGPSGGFTALTANTTAPLSFFAYKIVTTTGTYSTSWSFTGGSAGWDAPIASFE